MLNFVLLPKAGVNNKKNYYVGVDLLEHARYNLRNQKNPKRKFI